MNTSGFQGYFKYNDRLWRENNTKSIVTNKIWK